MGLAWPLRARLSALPLVLAFLRRGRARSPVYELIRRQVSVILVAAWRFLAEKIPPASGSVHASTVAQICGVLAVTRSSMYAAPITRALG